MVLAMNVAWEWTRFLDRGPCVTGEEIYSFGYRVKLKIVIRGFFIRLFVIFTPNLTKN